MNKAHLLLLSLVLFAFGASAQPFPMSNNPIDNCGGIFTDSGSDNPYGTDENFTTVICSDDGGNSAATHIRLDFFDFELGPGDTLYLYDGDSAAAPPFDLGFLAFGNRAFSVQATAANPSGCITAVFRSDAIDEGAAGWSADIECTPACQTIEALLTNSDPRPVPLDTGYIDICPGTEVRLEAAANFPQNGLRYQQWLEDMDILWDFGDGGQDTTRNTSHVFQEPGGYVVELYLFDSLGCRNSSFISQRVRVAPPPSFEMLTALDSTFCVEDTLRIRSSVDANNTNTDLIARANTGTFFPIPFRPDTIFLPDGVGVAYTSSITFNQFRPGSILESAEQLLGILVSIEHSYARDISINISCPNGANLNLLDGSAMLGTTNLGIPFACDPIDTNTSDSTPGIPYTYTFVNTSLANGGIEGSDTESIMYPATTDCLNGYTDRYLPPGEYEPVNALSALEGCPLNGEWTIRIQDNLERDNGWLFGWGLSFVDSLYRELERFSPPIVDYGWADHPTSINPSRDQFTATSSVAGDVSYTFWVEDSFGCINDTTLNFAILPPSHPACSNCELDFGTQEDLLICPGTSVDIDLSPLEPLEGCSGFQEYPEQAYTGVFGTITRDTHSLWINSLQPATLDNILEQVCSVCVDLPATQTSGIRIDLQAPDGTTLNLANGLVGTTGYTGTCFSPNALQGIVAAGGNYNGEFQPQQDWSALQGVPVNGEWRLLLTSTMGDGQQAILNDWSISFNQRNSYTYSWSPTSDLSGDLTSSQVTASPDQTTTYVLTANDNYGCTDTDTVVVNVLTDLPPPEIRCEENGPEIRFVWEALPGIPDYQYRITRDGITSDWSVPGPTTFALVDGLENGDVVRIEVRADISSLGLDCQVAIGTQECTSSFCGLSAELSDLQNNACYSDSNGSAQIHILSGNNPVQLSLNGSASTTDTLFTNLATGDYIVDLMDAVGCEYTLNFSITAPDSLTITPTQTFAACYGNPTNAAEVSVSGGSGQNYQIQWDDPASQTGSTASNLPEGPVSITVIDEMGCTQTTQLQVSNLDSITFNVLTVPPSCAGESNGGIGINQISGGAATNESEYNYSWNTGDTAIVLTDILGGLTYSVTVTDQQGCTGMRSRFLPDGLAIDPSEVVLSPPSCTGFTDGSIFLPTLTGPNYIFRWNAAANNQTTNPATGLGAGTYVLTVTDTLLDCSTEASFTLIDPQPLRVELTTQNNPCAGYRQGSISTTVSGGQPDYQYAWSTGSIGTTIFALPAGSYSLTVTDSNNCEFSTSTMLTEPEGLTATLSAEPVSCFGDGDGQVVFSVDGGNQPFRYSLDGINFTTSPTLIGLEAGTYTAYVEDGNDCIYTTSVEVPSPDLLTVDAGMDLTISFGDSIQLGAAVSGAQGQTNFQWIPPYAGIISCTDCPMPYATPGNTADYEVVVTDENGCEGADFVRVFVEKNRLVVVPTGFTPNGDSFNSNLIVHGRPGTEILRFLVYDRWGELVFERENFTVNDTSSQDNWDGRFRGQDADAGVYLWLLEARYEDGTTEVLRGQTTLIR